MTRVLVAAVLAFPLTITSDAQARHCNRDCQITHARHHCDEGAVRACILRAALHRRQSYPDMLRVATCESGPGLNPLAIYGQPQNRVRFSWAWISKRKISTGLFQFKPSTWLTTPYGRWRERIWSAKWSSLGAAWAWQRGRKGEWSCA